MQFENERKATIPCANTLCDSQGDRRFEEEALCDMVTEDGEPAYLTCKLYIPSEGTNMSCNMPTCRSQDPHDCFDCAMKEEPIKNTCEIIVKQNGHTIYQSEFKSCSISHTRTVTPTYGKSSADWGRATNLEVEKGSECTTIVAKNKI